MFRESNPSPLPHCEQPLCALKQKRMNRARLADLLIRAISKEESIDSIPEHWRITPRKVCIECANRVIRGHQPFLTIAEREQPFSIHGSSSPRRVV